MLSFIIAYVCFLHAN